MAKALGLHVLPALLAVAALASARSAHPQTASAASAAPAAPAAPLAADAAPRCPASANPAAPVALGTAQWNGWGRDVDNTRYQPEPALRASDVAKLSLRWAFALGPAASFGQPTVVGGRVFVTSSSGRVFSLDARSGCVYWTFDAAAAVDTPIVVGQLGKPRLVHRVFRRWMRHNAHIEVIEPPSAVLFGDAAGEVYALDARDGALLWKSAPGRSAGAAVSAAPVVYGDRLYVPLGPPARDPRGEGEVVALDLSSGSLAWRAQMPRSLLMNAGASGLPASPTIDARRGALYVAAGGEGAIVALSLLDGSPRWVAKPAEPVDPDAAPGPADPPILQTLPNGHQVLLAANAAGVAFCLDPDRNGAPLWQTRLVAGAEDVDWSHAADHRNVYVAVADRRRRDGHARGVLAAVDIASGKLRWLKNAPPPNCVQGPACARIHAHSVSVIPGIVFGASIGGHLRAYSTVDGSVVWDFDTARSFQATDGSVARGGRLGRGGATVVDGMVYLDAAAAGDPRSASGVLLAFSAGAK